MTGDRFNRGKRQINLLTSKRTKTITAWKESEAEGPLKFTLPLLYGKEGKKEQGCGEI